MGCVYRLFCGRGVGVRSTGNLIWWYYWVAIACVGFLPGSNVNLFFFYSSEQWQALSPLLLQQFTNSQLQLFLWHRLPDCKNKGLPKDAPDREEDVRDGEDIKEEEGENDSR